MKMNAAMYMDESWKTALNEEFMQPYMKALNTFLQDEKGNGKDIYPTDSAYFRALELTPLDSVKVVVLGQDPYHSEGQAHGLSFSVPKGIKIPPSLVNIYKELERDLGIKPAQHGFLEDWAKQGVLLLNSVLTVECGRAASHQRRGWERFTDKVIQQVNALDAPVVFMLWGAYAQKKAAFVDCDKHLVLTAPHPSPLSAHRGFLGCQHFSKANAFLEERGRGAINWCLEG
tara:strand:- start:790899 stop:791588 length:690 start_codon:yes stop_codon:yes gene_type:complete